MTDISTQQDSWALTASRFRGYLMTAGRSGQTFRTYSSNVHLFWRWCETNGEYAPLASRLLVRDWLNLRRDTVNPTAAYASLAALHAFFDCIVDLGQREENPTKGMVMKRTATLPTLPLSEGEIRVLFNACENERDRLIILILTYSGVRISEMTNIRLENIDWESGLITIPHGKGDKARVVSPAPEVMNRLRWIQGLFPEGSGPIWMSHWGKPLAAHQIRKIIYEIAKRAGVENVHPHRFRASFACQFLEQNHGDIHALKGAMGHSDITTTARYAEAVESARGMDKMRGLHVAI